MTKQEAAKILKLDINANEDQIKKAFRKLAMQFHPDKNNSEEAKSKFIEIYEAYDFLLNKPTYSSPKASYSSPASKYSATESHRKPNYQSKPQSNNYNQKAEPFTYYDYEMRYSQARKAYEDAFERRSQHLYAAFLADYQKGWKRKWAKIVAAISIIFALSLVIDYFVKENQILETPQFRFLDRPERNYIIYADNEYELDSEEFRYFASKASYVVISKTKIFKEIKQVDLVFLDGSGIIDITPITPASTFPIIPMILIFPLLSFYMEKPTFNFVFFVIHINLYLIPIMWLILSLRAII